MEVTVNRLLFINNSPDVVDKVFCLFPKAEDKPLTLFWAMEVTVNRLLFINNSPDVVDNVSCLSSNLSVNLEPLTSTIWLKLQTFNLPFGVILTQVFVPNNDKLFTNKLVPDVSFNN